MIGLWLGLALAGQGEVERVSFTEGEAVEAGWLAAPGERLPGEVQVEAVQRHAEFERMTLRLPDGRALQVELTAALPGAQGACASQGLLLQPRWELLGEVRDGSAQPPAIAELCRRMADGRPPLRLGSVEEDTEDGTAPQRLAWQREGPDGVALGEDAQEAAALGDPAGRPEPDLRPLWVGFGLLLLLWMGDLGLRAAAPFRPAALLPPGAVLLLSLAALALAPIGLLIGPDGGALPLALAIHPHADPLYGGGWTSLVAPLVEGEPARVFTLHRALALVVGPMAWLAARGALGSEARVGPLVAGLLAGTLPLLLRLAGSEQPHVAVLAVEAIALAAILDLGRGGWLAALVAGLGAGLAGHLRPEALPFLAAPLLLGLAIRAPRGALALAVALAGGLGAWRLAPMLGSPMPSGALGAGGFVEALLPWRLLPGTLGLSEEGRQGLLALNPWRTPFALPLLAAIGARRGGRLGLALVLLWLVQLLPVLQKDWPMTDAWRFQLPSMLPLLVLAGMGAQALPGAWRRLALFAPLTALPLLPWVTGPWAPRQEYQLLAELLPRLPEGARVLLPFEAGHPEELARVLTAQAGAAGRAIEIQPLEAFTRDPRPGADLFVIVGLRCRIGYPQTRPGAPSADDPCAALARVCALTPFATGELEPTGDVDLSWPDRPVQIGLYRIDGCGQGGGAY